jgi:hypothetical protein
LRKAMSNPRGTRRSQIAIALSACVIIVRSPGPAAGFAYADQCACESSNRQESHTWVYANTDDCFVKGG